MPTRKKVGGQSQVWETKGCRELNPEQGDHASLLALSNTSGAKVAKCLGVLRLGPLGQQDRVDVGEHTAGGNGDADKELVELLLVAHGKLHMARDNAGLFVVAGGVASELENLGAEVLEHGGEVYGRAGADARGVLALLEEAVHTADGELETRFHGAGDGLAALGLATTGRARACLAGHAVGGVRSDVLFDVFISVFSNL